LHDITPQTYLVGGSVRDLIINSPPVDYDLSVDGDPKSVADLLARRTGGHVVLLGGRDHALYRVVGKDKLIIDISQMKGRDIVEDLNERDFSINAMACRLTDGAIIDPAEGIKDLGNGTIRMLNPHTFDNDPLRLLRAYRMAACLNFQIDGPTRLKIREKADLIQSVAGERLWNELQQILSTPASHHQIFAMSRDGLLTSLFPELIPLKNCTPNRHHILDAYKHSLSALAALETIFTSPGDHLSLAGQTKNVVSLFQNTANDIRILLKLSILFHDLGKPETRSMDTDGDVHFYEHAARGADLVRRITDRLRMSSRQSDHVGSMVRCHQDPLQLYLAYKNNTKLSPRVKARFYRKHKWLSPYLLMHSLADEMGKTSTHPHDVCQTDITRFLRGMIQSYVEDIVPLQKATGQKISGRKTSGRKTSGRKTSGLINGNDIMLHLNLKPSPLIGQLLMDVETAYLAGEIHNRNDAIALAKLYLSRIKR
jgi:tRNA nucleotidyltransferase/poly(A) polymerase